MTDETNNSSLAGAGHSPTPTIQAELIVMRVEPIAHTVLLLLLPLAFSNN